jgi:SPP1 family phage portal protein
MQIEFTDRLSASQIQEALEKFDRDRYARNIAYYQGKNVKILERKKDKNREPNWIVSVPYARKIIKTVSGYMYKPGLITYSSDNDSYMEALNGVFETNLEPTKTASIGEQTSVQGVGYEIHYTDGTQPMFSKLSADKGIPIYDYKIEPELKAFIYFYEIQETIHIYVYYPNVIEHWVKKKRLKNDIDFKSERDKPSFVEEVPHEYETVPVNVYKNNEEMVGDFEPVLYLIDAYDALATDCMNEVDRFSNAYMVLKNISLSAQDAKKIKEVRVFDNVSEDAAVEILTKDIPHGYFQYLSEYYRREIHKQSHVPNFIEDATGGQLSGVAIDKLLYDFEFVAATKEQLFREGLRRRMQLINTILRKTKGDLGDESEIDIHFQRNKPQNMKENAEIINLLMGIITKETLINEYVPFVSDAQAEIEKVEEEEDVFGRETNLEAARPST